MANLKRLIINADDFGLSPGINKGIAECFSEGILTSASLVVNQPYSQQAVALSRRFDTDSIGLHLNLTFGPPISEPTKVASLLLERGGQFQFYGGVYGFTKTVADIDIEIRSIMENLETRSVFEDILEECFAQFNRFTDLMGRYPSHINTHHNIHSSTRFLEALMILGLNFGVPIRQLNREMKQEMSEKGILCTDRTIAYSWSETEDFQTSLAKLQEKIHNLQAGTTEFYCHPGYADSFLRMTSLYSVHREYEMQALRSPHVRTLLEELGIQLIDFGRLSND